MNAGPGETGIDRSRGGGEGQGARRLCPDCSAAETIGPDEPVWPLGWRCRACGTAVPVIDGVPSFAPDLAGTPVGFDLGAFDRLARQEAGHYWFEPRNRLLTGLADRFFPSARRYLEVGCGTGFVLDAFARRRRWAGVTGSELHPAGLVHARRRLGDRASFVQMDARHVPARGAFDLVGAYDVIEHIEEDEAVIAGIRDSLAPDGGVIIAVPQHPRLWSPADDIGQHVRRYRLGELEGKLVKAGFRILYSTSYTTLLLPLMVASRLKDRKQSAADLVSREFDLPSRLNRMLRAVSHAEVALTLRGLKLPVGGSRVVVART